MKNCMQKLVFLSVSLCFGLVADTQKSDEVAHVIHSEFTEHVAQAVNKDSSCMFLEIAGLKAAKKTLANGLEVVVIRQPSLPRVLVQLIYKGVGAVIEEKGEKGLAHLIEHMIFKGTPSLSEQNYFDVCKRYGASGNAWTSHDATSYYIESNKDNWKPFLHLFADCLQNALFDEQHLASEVKVVIKELRMGEDNPANKSEQELVRTMVPFEHPHHCCVIGYKADLANVTSDTLKNFFKKYYQPNKATLFLVGDLDLVDALATAEAELGLLQPGTVDLPNVAETEYPLNLGFHKIVYADRATDYVRLAWPLPRGFSALNYHADMLAAVLTGSENGLLTHRLVHEEQCAQAVGADTSEAYLSGGYFHIVCYPLPGQTEKCIALITQELEKFCTAGVAESYLQGVVTTARLNHALAIESLANANGHPGGIHYNWLLRYVASNDLDDCFNYVEKLAQVTVDDLKAFASAHLTRESMCRVDLVPLPESEREAHVRSLEEEQALEAKILAAHVRTAPVVVTDVPADYPPTQHIEVVLPKADVREQLASGPLLIMNKDSSSDICVFAMQHKDDEQFSGSLDSLVLGIASDMLLQGSAQHSRFEIENYFNKNGVNVSLNGTSWSVTSLSSSFVPALKFLFEVVLTATFDAADLEKLKTQYVAGFMMKKNDSYAVARRLRSQSLYPNTICDWSYDDAIARIQALTVDDIRAYVARYFDPKSMVCSVVGNIDMPVLQQLLTHAFAQVSSSGFVVEPFNGVEALKGNVDSLSAKDQVWIMYARQSPITRHHPDFPAVVLASEVLHGGNGGRIFSLREQTGLFYMIGGHFAQGAGVLPGVDLMYTQSGPELLPQVHACFEKFMAEDMRKPVTEQELANAKMLVRAAFAASVSGVLSKPRYFMALESNRIDEAYYNRFLAQIDALTAEEVAAAIARYLDAGEYIRIQVGNIPAQT